VTSQSGGIRNRIWLGGKFVGRDPIPVGITPRKMEATTITSNTALRIDRPYVFAGYPNIRNRHDIMLPWNTITESDIIEHLDKCAAMGGAVDLCVWKQVTDMFSAEAPDPSIVTPYGAPTDAGQTRFYLQRRQAVEFVTPPTFYDEYTTRMFYNANGFGYPTGDQEITITQVNGQPAAGITGALEATMSKQGELYGNIIRTPFVLSFLPPYGVADTIWVIYVPLYKVVISEQARSYGQNLQEPRKFNILEFG
jgi:hypothetical protein